jgi:glycosyltransferase involved in cell wall biosynthesis
VYPPVEIEQAQDSKRRGDYFVASPFDPNKGGRLIVDSAMRYGFKLKLYGTGPLSKELRKKARNHSNIEFLGWISDEERWKLLSKAKGYIYAGVEDLGIIPIEAMASGTPVIAYAKGGVLETVIDGKTGILFKDHTSTSLYEAILKLENTRFNKVVLKKHARRFSKKRYLKEIDELIGKGLRSFLIA